MDVGETIVSALEAESETLMIDAKEMHEGGVQVMYMDGILDDVVAVVVGFAVGHAFFHSGSGHEHGETSRVVVATIIRLSEGSLAVDGAAKLTTPDDECIIEKSALFEVFDEGSGGLVSVVDLTLDGLWQTAMMIPAHVEELDAADITLGESASEETVRGIGAGLFHIRAVEIQDVLRLFGDVHQIGDAGLHAKGHLILGDAGGGLGIAKGGMVLLIQGGEIVQHATAELTTDTSGVG